MRSAARSFLLVLLLCSFAVAQNTGNIYGKVTDSSGAPIPGVTVTATSPALINTQVQATGSAGLFHFPNLPIGTYKVTFAAPGFSTGVRDGIELQAGFTADVNMTMAKGTGTVASEHTQMVDQRGTVVQSTASAAAMGNVGASRDIYSIIAVTPGVTMVGSVDVGGNQAGTQRTSSAYDYRNSQARNMYDGVNVTEGVSGNMVYMDYGAQAELRQITVANDASMPVPGTFMNAVIKQGSNAFHAGIYFDYENQNFQGHNITQTQQQLGAGLGTRITRYEDLNGEIGGKVIKDRLWFYLSLRAESFGNSVTGWPAENPTMKNPPFYRTNLQNITEKITWRLTKNNRITHFIGFNNKQMPWRGAIANYWADATYYQDTPSYGANLKWDTMPTKNFSVSTMLGKAGYHYAYRMQGAIDCAMRSYVPLPCVDGTPAPRLYELANTDYAGGYNAQRQDRWKWQAQSDAKWFFDKLLGTSQNFSFGYLWEYEKTGIYNPGSPGNLIYWFNSAVGQPDFSVPYEVQLTNGPTYATDFVQHHGIYISDQIRLGKRAVLTPGIRWDYYRTYEPNEFVRSDVPWRAFYYAGAALPNGYSIPATRPDYTIPAQTVFSFPAHFAPRIGLAVDLTGKATTILKLSYGRFWNNSGTATSTSYINGLQYVSNPFTFRWNDPTLAPFNMNQLGAYMTGALSTTATVAPNIRLPHTDEETIFLEKQFTRTFSARAGFAFRRSYDDWWQQDIGRPWSLYTQWYTTYDPGPDGLRGTADDRGNLTVCCDIPNSVNPLPVSKIQVSNQAKPNEYYGWDVSFTKRMSNHWMLTGGYAWSAYHILAVVPSNPLQAYNNGELEGFWSSNFRGSYQAPKGFVISPTVRLIQGQPADRVLNVTGMHIGTFALIADPWGAYRYDFIPVFDTRVEKRLRFKEHYQFGLFFDAYNIMNGNGNVTYGLTTGRKSNVINGATYSYPTFQQPTNLVGPRVFRIGIKFNY